MNLNDIKDIISKSDKGMENFAVVDMATYSPLVNITLEMNRESFTYYYQITSDDLSKSKLTEENLKDMCKRGWRFDYMTDCFIRII